MNYVQRMEHWGETHHPKWMDLVRMALGVFLLVKGIEFANNSTAVSGLVSNAVPFSSFMLILLGHYIVFAHIVGGFMIATGLLTRLACLIQIPILLGAIVFVNWEVMNHFSLFLLSLLVLFLLLYFLAAGSGSWSLDRALKSS